MSTVVKNDHFKMLEKNQAEVRQLVLEGIKQVQEGKIYDFNEACDRLVEKYENAKE
ncbi:MAG: hypothetical protein LBC96_04250 [Lachnospiraceae bacterium]|jgi:hypothetical protein|nr:hypothetical protein [Lachnospiraceae bacterium]